MGSFCESRSGGSLQHPDALRLEHWPQGEEKYVFILNQNLLKRPCVYKKNNCTKNEYKKFQQSCKPFPTCWGHSFFKITILLDV